jgi:hypothetical protein
VNVVDQDGWHRYSGPLHRKKGPGMAALFSIEERKHDLSFVMQRIAAGDRARFFHSHFGQQVVELSRSWIWIFKRKTRVSLSPLEMARVKDALHGRCKLERDLAAITDAIEAWCAGRRATPMEVKGKWLRDPRQTRHDWPPRRRRSQAP